MSTEAIAALKIKKKREVQQARTLEELAIIQKERGYKKGWAYSMYHRRNPGAKRAAV